MQEPTSNHQPDLFKEAFAAVADSLETCAALCSTQADRDRCHAADLLSLKDPEQPTGGAVEAYHRHATFGFALANIMTALQALVMRQVHPDA